MHNPDLFHKPVYFISKQPEQRSFPDEFVNHIINDDCLNTLKYIPKNSIDLIVTSPPYFVDKTYERTWTYQEYNDLLRMSFKQCHRVLKPGRYMVVNFGDYFNRDRFYHAEIPSVFPASINYFTWGRETGFDLQATRIWRKKFTKMSIPFVCNSHPRPVFDYEHIWTFRKQDGTGIEFVTDRKLSQRAVLGENWSQPALLSDHDAAFPLDLPLWAIKVHSPQKQDLVLDPFFGAGMTMLACANLDRYFIGIELDPEFCRTAYLRMTSG